MKKLLITTAIVTLTTSIVFARGAVANSLQFGMTPSAAASICLPDAEGYVRVVSSRSNEVMQVIIRGLPPQTEFDLFLTQVPNPPFGLAWYQGDIETNQRGVGQGFFIGRFNEETFTVAPGTAVAPEVHDDAFPDVNTNPATGPVHQYHLGLWFDSPADAAAAGCPNTVTPFNGEHNAGILVLNTADFPDDRGPLFNLKP